MSSNICIKTEIDLEAIKRFDDKENLIYVGDKYRIIKKIGEGGTSNVFKAINEETNEVVALKIIKKQSKVISAKKRFELEGKTLKEFSNNENILKIFDYFMCGEYSVIVMEFLKGKTLKKIIREKGTLSIEETLNYTFKIINALKEMHSKNVMHRDLKPQNIIIDDDDSLKLTDFGIIQTSENQSITQTNYVVGSVEYMAPEILKGNKATPRSEIYSLGIIMYSMLTGLTPLKGLDFQDTAKKHLSEKPKPLRDLNPNVDREIEAIVLKTLAKNDFERYQNMEEFEIELFKYISNRELTSKEGNASKKSIDENLKEISNRNKFSLISKRRITIILLIVLLIVILSSITLGVVLLT